MPERRSSTEIRERALDALSTARRHGLPLSAVAPPVGLLPKQVITATEGAWQRRDHDWVPTTHDRLRRDMSVLTPAGPVQVVIRDSREASVAGAHANAVRHYRDDGLLDWIQDLPRNWVITDGGRVLLAVSPADLDRLMEGAELSYDVYQRL